METISLNKTAWWDGFHCCLVFSNQQWSPEQQSFSFSRQHSISGISESMYNVVAQIFVVCVLGNIVSVSHI
jgi:hypothetical protein